MFFLPPNPLLYLLIIGPAILISAWAQWKVKSAFNEFAEVRPSSGMTGAEAARKMLDSAGLRNVKIEKTEGYLSDHYDPGEKKLALSPEVHDERSISAVGVACHEAGHAIQDASEYGPLVIRNAIVPVAQFGSWLSFPLIMIGLLMNFMQLALAGVLFFGLIVVFQLINLPVEFNASTRAKDQLATLGIIGSREEQEGVDTVLDAAAMTYVAATLTALLQLLYFLVLVLGRR